MVVLTVETNGVDLSSLEIIKCCLTNEKGEKIYENLYRPSSPIPKEITEINGINDSDVSGKERFAQKDLENILSFLKGKNVAVYGDFSISVLKKYAKSFGIEMPMNFSIYDSKEIELMDMSLKGVYMKYFGDSLNDKNKMILEIFEKQKKNVEANGIKMDTISQKTWDNVLRLDIDGKYVFSKGKYHGEKLKDILIRDPQYVSFMERQHSDDSIFLEIVSKCREYVAAVMARASEKK